MAGGTRLRLLSISALDSTTCYLLFQMPDFQNLKIYRNISILLIFIINTFFSGYTQTYTRIECDFTIKEKYPNGRQMLTMGHVYFDSNIKKIVYQLKFPEKEILVVQDTVMFRIVDGKVNTSTSISELLDFSIFNLSLKGHLDYYGLSETRFQLTEMENDQGMVITSWLPPDELKDIAGKIMISQKDKKIFGIINFAVDSSIISKQFFESYINVQSIDFPEEVTQFFYTPEGEIIKKITYNNVVINNMENDEMYHYPVPGY